VILTNLIQLFACSLQPCLQLSFLCIRQIQISRELLKLTLDYPCSFRFHSKIPFLVLKQFQYRLGHQAVTGSDPRSRFGVRTGFRSFQAPSSMNSVSKMLYHSCWPGGVATPRPLSPSYAVFCL